jgi:UDP-N-acetylmuramoyl-tripeptide--D-alanyl-D-alanine ligase
VESIKAATDLLANYSGRRVLILGDMGELGTEARKYHQEVGEYAKKMGIDQLLTLGVLSQSASDGFYGKTSIQDQHFSDRDSLLTQLKSMLAGEKQPISILVKGSRSAKMEQVVQGIIDWQNKKYQEGVA